MNTDQLAIDARVALREQRELIDDMRQERKNLNERIKLAILEERRLTRITNAFAPRNRKAADNGESE
jgi:hypothetical protein